MGLVLKNAVLVLMLIHSVVSVLKLVSCAGRPYLHRWRLESSYGDDMSGNFTFVPQTGTPTFVTGVYDSGVRTVEATAGDLLVSGTTQAAIDGGDSFTASGWFKNNAAGTSTSLLYAWKNSVPTANVWFLDNNFAQDEVEFVVYDSGGGRIRAVGSHINTTDVWIFLCGTWNESTEAMVLYQGIDGAALTTTAGVESAWTGPRRKDAEHFRGGYFTVGDNVIDDLRVYASELTAAQVDDIYQDGLIALGG